MQANVLAIFTAIDKDPESANAKVIEKWQTWKLAASTGVRDNYQVEVQTCLAWADKNSMHSVSIVVYN